MVVGFFFSFSFFFFFILCKDKARSFVLRISLGTREGEEWQRCHKHGQRVFFHICILYKHKPASSETANEPVTRGL